MSGHSVNRHSVGAASNHGDRLTLTGLRVHANHGVYDFERESGQVFVIDLIAWFDLAAAGRSDDVATTVHYGELAVEVADAVRADPVSLIETVAERVASVVLAHVQVESVRVTVHKPDAPIPEEFDDVAVTIQRGRDGSANFKVDPGRQGAPDPEAGGTRREAGL